MHMIIVSYVLTVAVMLPASGWLADRVGVRNIFFTAIVLFTAGSLFCAQASTLDQLVKYPEFFHMPLVSGSYWPMVHGSNPEQVLQDAEGCAVMQELGRNMAWLLRCIEAGKAAGIQHPENPRRPMTNFIR